MVRGLESRDSSPKYTQKHDERFVVTELSKNPTPLEAAFNAEIQRGFGSFLTEPRVNKHGNLIRTGYPIFVGDSLVAFQYIRFDPLETHSRYLAEAYASTNKLFPEAEAEELEKDIEVVFDREEQILEAIKQGVLDRKNRGRGDAFNDPEYYVPGVKVEQWPELFEFSIFGPGNRVNQHVPPNTELGRRGKLLDQRPDIHGRLRTAPRLTNIRNPEPSDYEDQILIEHPRIYHDTMRATAIAFDHVNLDMMRKKGTEKLYKDLEFGDMGWFAPHTPLLYPVFPQQESPQRLMHRFGTLISELSNPTLIK